MKTLNKQAIDIDRFSFPSSEANEGRFRFDGFSLPLDSLKTLDLPVQWLSKNPKRFKLIPELMETLESDKYVWLTEDDVPNRIIRNRGELLQYNDLIDVVGQDFGNKTGTVPKYSLSQDLSIEVTRFFGEPLPVTNRVGDALRYGSRVRYDPATGLLDHAALCERLICTNGASKVSAKHSRSQTSAESQLAFVKEAVKIASLSSAELSLKAMLLSMLKIPDGQNPLEFLKLLCEKYGFSSAQTEAVLSKFNADGDVRIDDVSQWDLFNAISNATTHAPEFHENRSRWQDIGGAVMGYVTDKGMSYVNANVPAMVASIWSRN